MVVNFQDYQSPKFIEKKNKDFVLWGSDNLYPSFISGLINKSALHSSIFYSKAMMTGGGGINFAMPDSSNIDEKIQSKLDEFSLAVNPQESMWDVTKKLAFDLEMYGGFCLQVIWNKTRDKILEVYHTDISGIRSGKNNDKGQVENYYWSDDWSNINNPKITPIKSFDLNNKKGTQMIFVKPYMSGVVYYPIPTYESAINYINLDWSISKFHNSAIENGLQPSMVINFPTGYPSDEEMDKIYQNIKKLYGGGDNAGKFILTFSQDKETAPTYTPIQVNDLDKQYDSLENKLTQHIITAHRLTSPMLAGIKSEGQLGGRNEIIEASELFHSNVIRPNQILIENVWNKILKINGFGNITAEIENIKPLQFQFSDTNMMLNIFTMDELRQMAGFDAMNPDQIPAIIQNNQVNSGQNTPENGTNSLIKS